MDSFSRVGGRFKKPTEEIVATAKSTYRPHVDTPYLGQQSVILLLDLRDGAFATPTNSSRARVAAAFFSYDLRKVCLSVVVLLHGAEWRDAL